MSFFLVAAGAALGGPLRYLIDRRVQAVSSASIPLGTLAVNLSASFVLGLVAGAATDGRASMQLVTLLGTGFCGALSTYSTFAYEHVRLAERARRSSTAYVALSLVGGLGLVALGVQAGHGL